MSEKLQWSLREIRNAYGEILRAYNALFPLSPDVERGEEVMADSPDTDEESSYLSTMKSLKKAHNSLKEAAKESGNAQCWRVGEPLDGVNERMRARISKALELGI